MPSIPLTQGKFAEVDQRDYAKLAKHKWYAYRSRGVLYAGRTIYRLAKMNQIIQMHAAILGKKPGLEIDHKDRDGLTNRRSNLHFVTHAMNCRNRRKLATASSKYIGVSLDKKTGKWRAYIKNAGKLKHLGLFQTEEEAAKVREHANKKLFSLIK